MKKFNHLIEKSNFELFSEPIDDIGIDEMAYNDLFYHII
jgi:hypothetical protein